MAYKVGTTIVIDDSGNVDWSRIANKPVIGTGDITSVTVTNGTPSGGAKLRIPLGGELLRGEHQRWRDRGRCHRHFCAAAVQLQLQLPVLRWRFAAVPLSSGPRGSASLKPHLTGR